AKRRPLLWPRLGACPLHSAQTRCCASTGAAMSTIPEPKPPDGSKPKRGKIGSGIAVLGLLLLKLLKFVLLPLKLLTFSKFAVTFISMAVTTWFYAQMAGASFAIGLVGLIFIHEMGHAAAIRLCGLRAGAPVFIPFFGAVIALRDQPHDVLTEAKIAIAGPLLG